MPLVCIPLARGDLRIEEGMEGGGQKRLRGGSPTLSPCPVPCPLLPAKRWHLLPSCGRVPVPILRGEPCVYQGPPLSPEITLGLGGNVPRAGSGWAPVPVGFPWFPAEFRSSLVQEGRARRSARHFWRGRRCVLLSIASRFHRRPIKTDIFPRTRCRILFILAAQRAAAPRLGHSQLSPLLQAAPGERFSTDPAPSEGIWGLCPHGESSRGRAPPAPIPLQPLFWAALVPPVPAAASFPISQVRAFAARLEFRLQELLLLQASHPSAIAAVPGAPRNGATWNWLRSKAKKKKPGKTGFKGKKNQIPRGEALWR